MTDGTTEVTILRHDGQAMLVEWLTPDGAQRGIVPAETIRPGRTGRAVVADGDLACAAPWGVPWEDVIAFPAAEEMGKRLAAELRKRGIWTAAELRARPMEGFAALQAASGVDLASLLRAIANM